MEERKWSPRTPAITAEALPHILVKNRVVVLHFWAEWDLHDRRVDEALQAVRAKYADRIVFYAVDVDDTGNHSLCRDCSLWNIPALACFINGQWEETYIGIRPVEELERKLQEWLQRSEAA